MNAQRPAKDLSLEIRGLSKHFGEFRALSEVSFGVRAGEVLGLIGPNGAGKTTLFECLAGLMAESGGGVYRDGARLEAGERAGVLFYVPDGICPWSRQRLNWVLDYAVGFFGGRGELRAEVVDQLGLREQLGKTMETLSKGQRKRALLAVGLLAPQPVVLIDEPFDGLDLRQTRDVAKALRAHAAGGRTLFLSIHQIESAARLCDRFVLLSDGAVRGEGTAEELAELAARRQGEMAGPGLEEVFLALT